MNQKQLQAIQKINGLESFIKGTESKVITQEGTHYLIAYKAIYKSGGCARIRLDGRRPYLPRKRVIADGLEDN